MVSWRGFSKKNPAERWEYLKESQLLSHCALDSLTQGELLPLARADQIAENVIGRLALPMSLAPDFLIDGKTYHLPMVTEEPSVVAAASYAARLIRRSGGFTTKVHQRRMIGQITLTDVPEQEVAGQTILAHTKTLISQANAAHPSILKRGGGARELWIEHKDSFLIVYISVDTKEAMGANIVNTMMEALSPTLEKLSEGRCLMAILSNYATESLVTAECRLDWRFLSRKKAEARELAYKIDLASRLAQVDSYRAATHNKGIFNGIDALVLATGNDWRAIEAGCHAYASASGSYRGLSQWTVDLDAKQIIGRMTLPMPIATKGGSIGLNPSVQTAFELLGNPDAKTLAGLIVSLGLAQNFAALKALVSTGIQAGHMKLQAKSLALQAGATDKQITQVVDQLLQAEHMNLETAQAIVKELD
ncbi:hydroxymethylglutaryl-CoA reductase, degradative [Streptococcus dentasini]